MARGWKVWTALGIIYFVWGSTYPAIKVSVETLPPFLSAGLRFSLAGALLAGILALRRTRLVVPWREARAAVGLGVALLACGVGVVTFAETKIDSSIAALIAGSVPLQVILWRTIAHEQVAKTTRLSAVVGLGGLALIIVPNGLSGRSSAVGLALMLGASLSWSIGSFVSRKLPLPRDPFVATVYEMLGAGIVLVAVALVLGEGGDVARASISAASVAAWLYLAIAGSLVAFTAYAWLLRTVPISQVVTHQYVNPLVAIAIGALWLNESLDLTTALGALIVVGGVFATVRSETRAADGVSPPEPAVESRGNALAARAK
jgi:drug/metabolite transporter (DMT)-like permease